MGCSFNLRHQVSELEDARLTVLPVYLDGAVIFFYHFALSLIGNPDYSIAHLQSLGFLRLHLMEKCARNFIPAKETQHNYRIEYGLEVVETDTNET